MNRYLQLGKYTAGLPPAFVRPFRQHWQTKPHTAANVRLMIEQILKHFSYQEYLTNTHDLAKSRFVGVRKIISIRLRTCGSLASITASVLRQLGYPTKLIDGRFRHGQKIFRHAWIEVNLDPEKKYRSFDPNRYPGRITKSYLKRGQYVDWSELETKISKPHGHR